MSRTVTVRLPGGLSHEVTGVQVRNCRVGLAAWSVVEVNGTRLGIVERDRLGNGWNALPSIFVNMPARYNVPTKAVAVECVLASWWISTPEGQAQQRSLCT